MQAIESSMTQQTSTPGGASINVNEFAAKFKGKREIFNFLTIDVKAYLPAYETITVYFMKELICGTKLFISCHRIRHLYVPQYESLKLAHIMENVMTIPEALAHLPLLKELKKVPKAWLCDIVYSVVGDTFAAWVADRISERNKKVTIQKDLNISIHPDVLKAFMNSNAVSLSKGTSVQMLKANAKRRMSRAECEEKKRMNQDKDAALKASLEEVSRLKSQLAQSAGQAQELKKHQDLVVGLQKENVIKIEHNGTVSINSTPARPMETPN